MYKCLDDDSDCYFIDKSNREQIRTLLYMCRPSNHITYHHRIARNPIIFVCLCTAFLAFVNILILLRN